MNAVAGSPASTKRALRLTFEYSGSTVELVGRQDVDIVPPPTEIELVD